MLPIRDLRPTDEIVKEIDELDNRTGDAAGARQEYLLNEIRLRKDEGTL
jgi:hypothetical protein